MRRTPHFSRQTRRRQSSPFKTPCRRLIPSARLGLPEVREEITDVIPKRGDALARHPLSNQVRDQEALPARERVALPHCPGHALAAQSPQALLGYSQRREPPKQGSRGRREDVRASRSFT